MTFAFVSVAKADELLIQDDGNVLLLITNNGVLGISTTTKDQPKSNVQPQHPQTSTQQQNISQKPTEDKKDNSKTVPLVPPNTQSTVQINPPINNDKKVQVIVTTNNINQPPHIQIDNQIKNFVPTQIPAQTNVNSSQPHVIARSVDQVIAQGASGKPVITIKSDKANELTIQQGSTKVTTLLPLQIDTLSHSLNVASKNQQAVINVLPSEALQGVLEKGFLDAQSANNAKINLTSDSSGVNYNVNSQKRGKLFGVINVQTPVQVRLSAQTGKVVNSSQSPLFSIFGGLIR